MTSATESTTASPLVALSRIILSLCLLVNYYATDVSSSVIAVSSANACPQFCECGLDKDAIASANCSRILPERISFADVQSLTIVPPSSDEVDEYSLLRYIPAVFPKLKYLYVSRCGLSHLSHSRFKQLSSLREINLSDNRLSEFSPHLFSSNHRLLYVNLRKNPSLRLKAGKPLLVSKTVVELDLSRCNLSEIPPDAFSGLPNLRYLRLEYNRLTTLHSNSMPAAIRTLTLAGNVLVNVPIEELLRLKNLQEVDLSENPINCTCELMGFQNWVSGQGVIFLNNIMCSTPYKYRDWRLLNVPQYDICEAVLFRSSSLSNSPSSSGESSYADGGIYDNSILPIGEDARYDVDSDISSGKKTIRGGALLDEGPDAIFENDEMLPVSKKSNKRQNEPSDDQTEGSGDDMDLLNEGTPEIITNEPNLSLIPSTDISQQVSTSESSIVEGRMNQLEGSVSKDDSTLFDLVNSSDSSSSTTNVDKEPKQVITTTAVAESDKPIDRSAEEQESHTSTDNTEPLNTTQPPPAIVSPKDDRVTNDNDEPSVDNNHSNATVVEQQQESIKGNDANITLSSSTTQRTDGNVENSSIEDRMKDAKSWTGNNDDKKLITEFDTSIITPATDTNTSTSIGITVPNEQTESPEKSGLAVKPNNDVSEEKIIKPSMTNDTVTASTTTGIADISVTDTTVRDDVQKTPKETTGNETADSVVATSAIDRGKNIAELQAVGQPHTGETEQNGIFDYSLMYIIPCVVIIVFVLVCLVVYASQRRKTFRKSWSLDDNPTANNEATELQDVSLLSDSARGNIVKRNNSNCKNNNATDNNGSSSSSKYPNETESEQTVRLMSAPDHTEEQPDGKPVMAPLASWNDDEDCDEDEPVNKLSPSAPPTTHISTETKDKPKTDSGHAQKLLPNGSQPSPTRLEQPEVDNEIQFAKTRLINLPDSIPKTAILIDRNSTIDADQK